MRQRNAKGQLIMGRWDFRLSVAVGLLGSVSLCAGASSLHVVQVWFVWFVVHTIVVAVQERTCALLEVVAGLVLFSLFPMWGAEGCRNVYREGHRPPCRESMCPPEAHALFVDDVCMCEQTVRTPVVPR